MSLARRTNGLIIVCSCSLYISQPRANAFVHPLSLSSLSSSTSSRSLSSSFLQLTSFPNPFADNNNSNKNEVASSRGALGDDYYDWKDVDAYLPLIRQFLATDNGVLDSSYLSDDDFVFIGPNVVADGPLNKDEYLAAANFFNLRGALPDLEYRPHDVRLVSVGTVRFTTRVVGTFRGSPLRLRNDMNLSPNGQRMACPPESVTITFDLSNNNKPVVTRLVSGYTMDRQVGNTAGLCGVQALATVGGMPPNDWTLLPPQQVLQNIFRRTMSQLPGEPSSYLAPFPESVMLQLCKGVLNANLGLDDVDGILDTSSNNQFEFITPTVGPLNLKDFKIYQSAQNDLLRSNDGGGIVGDVEYQYSNFRVDPYDPYRVWVDVRASLNNDSIRGPPEAWSFTFDDSGYCTRITANAVLDPTDPQASNVGGLGGVAGLLYAANQPLSPWSTRPLPQIFSRITKIITQPITNVNVDDFATQLRSTPEMASVEINTNESITPLTTTTTTTSTTTPSSPARNIMQSFQKQKPPTTPPQPTPPTTEKMGTVKKPSEPKPPKTKPSSPSLNIMQSFQQTPTPPAAAAAKKSVETPKKKKPSPSLNIFQNQSTKIKDSSTSTDADAAKKQKEAKMAEKQKEAFAAKKAKNDQVEAKRQAQQEEATAKKEAMEAAKQAKDNETAAKKEAVAKGKEDTAVAKKKTMEAAKQAKQEEAAAKKEAMINAKENAAATKKEEIEAAKQAKQEEAAAKKVAIAKENTDTAKRKDMEAAKQAKQQEAAAKKEAIGKAKEDAAAAAAKKATMEAAKQAKQEVATAKKAAMEEAKQAKQEEATAKKAAMEAAKQAKQEELAAKKAATAQNAGKKKNQEKAEQLINRSSSGSTISLPSFLSRSSPKETSSPSQPLKKQPASAKKKVMPVPKGVPVLSRWRKNRNGSISGKITGSKGFDDGESITTSPIADVKTIQANSVVQTQSGSKYYLN